MSNQEEIKIEFWEDENGDCPVIGFLDNDLSEKISNQIYKKIGDVLSVLSFNALLQDKDRLTILSEYKLKPHPYEVKFKSQKVRIVAYRENNTLFLVEAVVGSFSNKKILKKAINIYQKRVCL